MKFKAAARIALCSLALWGTCSMPAAAQANFPNKPIRIAIASDPGASLDVYARLYADWLREAFKSPVLVEYKPGGGSTLASSFVARAPADGYTLGLMSSALATSILSYKELPYDPVGSFAPISLTATEALLLIVNPALGVNNLQEYLAYVRANPAKVNIGTTGPGAFNHLTMALLHHMTGTKVTFVHYKAGAQVIADLLANRIQGSMNTAQLAKPQIDAGKVRPLGIGSRARSPLLPNLASFAEQGVPDYNVLNWRGFMAPAQTPPAVISRLNQEMNRSIQSKEFLASLAKIGVTPVGSTPEEFRKFLIEDINRWKSLANSGDLELGPTN